MKKDDYAKAKELEQRIEMLTELKRHMTFFLNERNYIVTYEVKYNGITRVQPVNESGFSDFYKLGTMPEQDKSDVLSGIDLIISRLTSELTELVS